MLQLLLPLLWAGPLAQDKRFTLTVQTPVTVQEGLCVQVACNVSYPQDGWDDSTPAHGYWYREQAGAPDKVLVATNNPSRNVQEETQGRFHLLGDPKTYNCSLDIRDARRTDDGFYTFRVERGSVARYSYRQSKLTVRVTGALQNQTPGGCLGNRTGLSGPGAEVMLVAIAEAAVKTLLLLPCLLVLMQRHLLEALSLCLM
ncbi:Sialic acid-binding Ig-like lectin 12 [Myotis davidii]|uniref:Sialic acid-binding Ig-like lectin 12 n=1 Tax=Myotis davidii TaxID=225400 RepID=L5MJG2_MYODS|nr:Sialic acid-binding Ig-like lectin 12 [Myotis davidii]